MDNTHKGTGRWVAANYDGEGQFSIRVLGRDQQAGNWAGFNVQMTTDDAYILMKKLSNLLEEYLQPPLGE